MAYIDQAKKKEIAVSIKRILKKYNLKGSLSIHNHMALVLTIKQGPIDFVENYNEIGRGTLHRNYGNAWKDYTEKSMQINPYHFQDHFSGVTKAALLELYTVMMAGNHNNSDIQSDYFDTGWYVDINIGKWDKPYALEK